MAFRFRKKNSIKTIQELLAQEIRNDEHANEFFNNTEDEVQKGARIARLDEKEQGGLFKKTNNFRKTRQKFLNRINDEIKAIKAYLGFFEGARIVGFELRSALFMQDEAAKARVALDKMVLDESQQHVKSREDAQVIELYNKLFQQTLAEEKIAKREFDDQTLALTQETKDVDLARHLLINLRKQKAIAQLLLEKNNTPTNEILQNGVPIIATLIKLFEEQKWYYALIVRSARDKKRLHQKMREAIAWTAAKGRVRRKGMMILLGWGTATFFALSIYVASLYIDAKLRIFPQPMIVEAVQKELHGKDFEKILKLIPDATIEQIWARIIANDQAQLERFFDSMIDAWSEQIYVEYVQALEARIGAHAKLIELGITTDKIVYNKFEIMGAIKRTLRFYKPQLVQKFLELDRKKSARQKLLKRIELCGLYNPCFVSRIEQEMNKWAYDFMAPKLAELNAEMLKRMNEILKQAVEQAAKEFLPEWLVDFYKLLRPFFRYGGFFLGIGFIAFGVFHYQLRKKLEIWYVVKVRKKIAKRY